MSELDAATSFQQAPIAISVTDTRGAVVAVNAAFGSLFGVEPDDLIGQPLATAVAGADPALTAEIRRRLINGDIEVFRSTERFRTVTGIGQLLNVVVTPKIDETGQRTGLITTYDFATPGRTIDDDSYLQRILAAAQSSLLTLDRDGVVHSSGGRHGDALGYPAEFWHARPFAEVVIDADRPRFEHYLGSVLDQPNEPVDVELQVHAADGSVRAILASASNLLDDPAVTAIVMSFQDVSELHLQITDLVEERQVAETLARDRADLIATVSHELRNPLHALQGLAEILATSDLPGDLNEVAHELHSQLSGLASVTSDLLETARADRDEIVLHPVPTDVGALLERGLQYGRAAVGNKPVEVQGFLESNTPDAVMIDAARVDQIMRNLVGNAAKFTDRGSVNVTIGPIAHGLHLTVSDSGSGIPQTDIANILKPFARGSNSVGASGAGLGLAIVNDLARSMKGRVFVDSRVGRGSTFRVELQAPKSLSAPPAPRSADDLARFDLNVLVVDDDRTNRVIATRQLERFGCNVLTAQSGEEAIELLKQPSEQMPVDIVLMDRRMPGLDGAATTLQIRTIAHRRDIHVIGLTASASAEEQAECAAASMNAFLAKPASLFDLHEVIERYVHTPVVEVDGEVDTIETTGDESIAPGVAEADQPLVNPDRVQELVAEFDDVGIVRNLLGMFGTDLTEQIHQLTSAQTSGDLDTVGRIAHTIKGSAAMLGAAPLESAARAIEHSPDAELAAFEQLAAATAAESLRLGDDLGLVVDEIGPS